MYYRQTSIQGENFRIIYGSKLHRRFGNSIYARIWNHKEEAKYLHSEVAVSTNTYSHKKQQQSYTRPIQNGEVKDIANVSEIVNISMLAKKNKSTIFAI